MGGHGQLCRVMRRMVRRQARPRVALHHDALHSACALAP